MLRQLLEPRELRVLESLRLNPARAYRGATRGERVSKRKGISIEFADFRNYSEGDDLRHLDWNVLARLDTPVLRTYQDEEDLNVYVMLDCSPSMNFGEPTKLEVARRYAAALGYVGLLGGDGVRVKQIGRREPLSSAMRGRASAYKLMDWSQRNAPDPVEETLLEGAKTLLRSNLRAGIALLISDGLDEELPATIRSLGGRGFEVWMLQILSDAELYPDLEGDLRLLNSEGPEVVEITINRETLAAYRENLQSHLSLVSESVRKTGGRYCMVETGANLEEVIQRRLKPAGWFQ